MQLADSPICFELNAHTTQKRRDKKGGKCAHAYSNAYMKHKTFGSEIFLIDTSLQASNIYIYIERERERERKKQRTKIQLLPQKMLKMRPVASIGHHCKQNKFLIKLLKYLNPIKDFNRTLKINGS
jgi:hypothetical protein